MERYESYKDSGIEWIGKIPSHWGIIPLKRIMQIRNGQDYKLYTDNDRYPVIGSGGCFAYCSRFLYDGEALLLGRKGTIDKPLYIKGRFWVVDTMFYAVPKIALNVRYCYYQALTIPFDKYSTSTALPSMTQTDLGYHIFCLPPFVEQQVIVAYLEKRCSEIDKAIATQQKRIALLQELKQSIITHAVTQGIHSDVPLKDSGVEWIGKVPEHWEVMKTSLLYTNIGSGTTPSTSKQEYYEDDGFCWLQTGDLNDDYITDTSKKISKVAVKDYKLRFYPVGSIVIAMYGATIGKIGLLKIPTATNQACCVLPYSNKMNEMYAFYVCQIAKSQMLLEAVGGGQPNISQDIIKKLKLPVPPLCEQQAIAVYLDGRCSEIDKAIATQQKRIALLQELRQSVIKEVITGKIKVC